MDDSPSALLKLLLPKIPALGKAAALHSLWLSPTSTKWDLRTELTVNVLRSFMTSGSQNPSPLGKTQRQTLKDSGAKGKLWTARVVVPKPAEDDSREAVFRAVDEMGDGTEQYTKAESVGIRAEWTGFRSEAKSANEALPDLSEEEKYDRLMKDSTRTSRATVLYFHGGAYYLCGFGTHRLHISKLARACNGRAFAIEYRLAPQAAFPAQLIDALNSYLYLMYPPEGALHEPIPAKDIVFAGDSAGGNLSFALLQLLLQMHRTSGGQDPTVRYHGKEVAVPLPGGVTAASGWFDITRSMPSIDQNTRYDYLPPANHDDAASRFPADEIWPAEPPRGDLFADLSMICHPLCSPVAATSWEGAPPLWLMTGEECLTDEDAVVAARAASQGVTVQWEQYEAMPHVFAMMIPHLATSRRCYKSWGDFCRLAVEAQVETSGTWIPARSGKDKQVDITKVTDLTYEEVLRRMRDAQRRRLGGWEKEGKTLPKPSL